MLLSTPANVETYHAKTLMAKPTPELSADWETIYNAAQLLIYNSPRPHGATSKAYFLCIPLCPTS